MSRFTSMDYFLQIMSHIFLLLVFLILCQTLWMVYGKTSKICSYLSFNIICKFQVLQVHRFNFLPQCSNANALLEFYLPESGRVTVGTIPEESLSSLCEFLCRLWFRHFFQFYNCFLRHGKISNNDSILARTLYHFSRQQKQLFLLREKLLQKRN